MQHTPNPDVNSPTVGDDPETNIERENEETPATPPDETPNIPIEEPPETDQPAIEDDRDNESPRVL